MNNVRKFNVLQNTYGKMSIYEGRPLMNKGEIVDVNVLENGIHVYNNWRFHPSWFDMWLNVGCLEEIIESNETQNLTEENTNIDNDIYSKKYNIYEILTLIPNLPKDTEFKCSVNNECVWEIDESNDTLFYVNDYDEKYYMEEYYSLRQILEATYTIVKPIEEVKEKWVEIETHKDLCNAIVNKKMIRLGDGKPSNEYNDKQIETLFGALSHGVFKIEYLEE